MIIYHRWCCKQDRGLRLRNCTVFNEVLKSIFQKITMLNLYNSQNLRLSTAPSSCFHHYQVCIRQNSTMPAFKQMHFQCEMLSSELVVITSKNLPDFGRHMQIEFQWWRVKCSKSPKISVLIAGSSGPLAGCSPGVCVLPRCEQRTEYPGANGGGSRAGRPSSSLSFFLT